MAENSRETAQEVDSCPLCVCKQQTCWGRSSRRNDGRCRDCRSKIRPGINNTQKVIRYHQPFYDAAIHFQLYIGAAMGSMPALDTEGADNNLLNVHVDSSSGRIADFSVTFSGTFSTQNDSFSFDSFIQDHFSSGIEPVLTEFCAVRNATLASGFANLFCSITSVGEEATTELDGQHTENEYDLHNLGPHFKYYLICRLRELVDSVILAIRFEDGTNEHGAYCADAYAGASILYRKLKCLITSLKNWNKELRGHMSLTLRNLVVDWFTAVTSELEHRLIEGCGRYPLWQQTFKGSLRKLRGHHESFAVHLTLQQNKSNPPNPPDLDSSGETSFLELRPQYYNPATGEAGTMAELDSRYLSTRDWYSSQDNQTRL
ncbi:hypothetical protein DL98DRAFT_514957 [Cadophora sp. DSE1049]|nr:hypothetical protein DL98DRAFT_514957 [Cadophora sp. DSE1049]